MKPGLKIAAVVGGYVSCALIATAVVAMRIAGTSGPDAQASSGMYAFGDAITFVAVFGLCALVPTALALVFLRPHVRFWTVLSTIALCVAVTGVIAALLFAVGRAEVGTTLAAWAQFSVLRILVAPLFALTFLVCAGISPWRPQRLALLVATAMEAAVSAYAMAIWFIPIWFGRD
jgi:hypothetical protein